MPEEPLVSIIILNYNGIKYVENCLRSVLNTNYTNFEVIFVDNASTDGSYELIKRLFGSNPRIKIIRNKSNLGFSGGNNVGFRYAKGKYIVLLNNDTIVDPNWLAEMIYVLETHPDIAIAQPVIVHMENPKKIQNMGFLVDRLLLLSKPIGSLYDVEKIKNNCVLEGITYASGACLFIRREALKKIGYFDPKFKIYFDDSYWGMLAWLAGLKVATITTTKIYHKESATIDVIGSKFKAFYGTAARIAIIIRLYPMRKVIVSLLCFLALWFLYTVYKAFTSRMYSIIISTLKAYMWSLMNIGYIVGWRKKIKFLIKEVNYRKMFKHLMPNPFASKRVISRLLQIIRK